MPQKSDFLHFAPSHHSILRLVSSGTWQTQRRVASWCSQQVDGDFSAVAGFAPGIAHVMVAARSLIASMLLSACLLVVVVANDSAVDGCVMIDATILLWRACSSRPILVGVKLSIAHLMIFFVANDA